MKFPVHRKLLLSSCLKKSTKAQLKTNLGFKLGPKGESLVKKFGVGRELGVSEFGSSLTAKLQVS